ncbi:protein of unknown function [Sterolibacterium denitrificans]|uniref:GTPase n=1 Tax=Sterolibacterium denitrificans TaxID=157592 RepID=A0A7Z7MU13_9PROT|nr:hypothetical protein [Sterolibacterium denitrificans]SMB21331.1 protein of unknown function [Sterolibacterium denitrificans]
MSSIAGNALANLALPSPDGGPAPQFTSLADCKRWLADLAITNTALARDQLLQQLERLNRHPLPAAERLAILEFLRSPLHFIHDEWLRPCLLQRPELPLAAATEAGFAAMHMLWQALASGYLLVLQNAGAAATASQSSADERTQAALAATRALATMRSIHLDHCHLGLLPDPDFWQRLHRIHHAAECLDVSQLAVADKPAGMAALTAAGAYVETLLLAAAQPHELQPKQLDNVAYWARRWAAKVPLLLQPPEDPRTPPLCIDLSGSTAGAYAQPPASPPASLRWLDLRALRKTIKQRLVKLGEGVSPQELKLGKGCVQPDCELLLRRVYRDWCKGGRPAIDTTSRPCELLTRIESIHFQLSGKPFNPVRQSIYLDKRAHEELATFGHVATRAAGATGAVDNAAIVPPEHASEHWQAAAGSLVDLQLQRPLAQPGSALTAGRLIGVRQQHAPGWQLARIGWIASDLGTASLRASIRLLPGTPQAVSLIRAVEGTSKTEHCRGFHLPAVPGLEQAATLLTPTGWFRPGQPIEIQGERSQKVRLSKLLERGADFERCAYEPIA